jgi:Uri superfamily endonuclease
MHTYQLHIRLGHDLTATIGKLGTFRFPAGDYIYTGSARRNIHQRVARHLRKDKKLRWHIDYLLAHPAANITNVRYRPTCECAANQQIQGEIVVRGFGASDCQAGCGSHLRRLSRISGSQRLPTASQHVRAERSLEQRERKFLKGK